MRKRIGFIGLGLMGMPMAKNILKRGFPLSVYSRTADKTRELIALGAQSADSPRALGQDCDVVITMVTGPADVESVLLGENGVLSDPKKGLVVIDMSTIGPTAARTIGIQVVKRGARFVDAPVTGSVVRATSGELTIFIGAQKDVFEEIKPVLLAMGTTLHHMGEVGAGQAIKLVNNYFVAVEAVALSEGMMLADSMRLSRAQVADVLQSASTGMSPAMKLVIANHATGNYPVIFSLSNMRKDVSLAFEEVHGKKLTMLTMVKEVFDRGVAEGLSDEDFSAIIKSIEKEESR